MQYKLKVLKINSDENIKIHQFKFNRKGPKILVTGGVHGNESNGMLVCMEFINYIKKHSEKLCGEIYVIPLLNEKGFQEHTRRNNEVDLNRAFFDGSDNKIFQVLKNFLEKIDYGLDFHDSGEYYDLCLHARTPKNKELKELINHLDVPITFLRDGKKGMLTNYMNKKNKPFITIENGGNQYISDKEISKQIDIIVNLMKYKGNHIELAKQCNPKKIVERFRFRTKKTVMFFKNVKLNQKIKKGDLIGYTQDFNLDEKVPVFSPINGYIISLTQKKLIKFNRIIYEIGSTEDCNTTKVVVNDDKLKVKQFCL